MKNQDTVYGGGEWHVTTKDNKKGTCGKRLKIMNILCHVCLEVYFFVCCFHDSSSFTFGYFKKI